MHCPTPVAALPCPRGAYCPLGSDKPIACPPFLHFCDDDGLAAPNTRPLASTATLLCLGLLALLAWVEARPAPNPQQTTAAGLPRRNVSMDLLVPRLADSSAARGGTSYATVPQTSGGGDAPLSPRSTWLSEVPFADPPLDVCFRGLGLTLSSGRQVLRGVSGNFRSGRLAAILGPSGVGKTSFLNVLCGKGAAHGNVTGCVTVQAPGGEDALPHEAEASSQKGSVLQDLTYAAAPTPSFSALPRALPTRCHGKCLCR
jgi:hypothetical protein